ncbi:MAG: pyruvate ferredoxin oxidoreductase, partial [Candidatus Thiodiazotropha taylori]|nr:pyruvate ferredoxin oxidoreductase [Candidatus Thiodiazotropha taylori]
LRCYRPFPKEVLREALQGCQRVVVFEKCLAVGMGGIVAANVRMSIRGLNLPVYTVIGGLGGRPITRKSLAELFAKAMRDDLDETTFLDIKCDIVERELAREQAHTRSGAAAENILREVGVVDAAKTA